MSWNNETESVANNPFGNPDDPHAGFKPNPNVGKMQRSDRGRSAKRKGASGEREVLVLFVAAMVRVESDFELAGHTVRRYSDEVKRNTLQSDRGGFDIHGIPLLAVEVKRCETLSIGTWKRQCIEQAKKGELAVLIYRQSGKPWRVQTWMAGPVQRLPVVWAWSELAMDDFISIYARMHGDWLAKQIDAKSDT